MEMWSEATRQGQGTALFDPRWLGNTRSRVFISSSEIKMLKVGKKMAVH